MKYYKFFTGMVFFLLLMSTTSSLAYTPTDSGFVEASIFAKVEDRNNVVLGETVDFSIVFRNLTNDTISNITITQIIRPDTELITIEDQPAGNFTSLTLTDSVTGKSLPVTYFNVTDDNFMINIDISLEEDNYFAINFVMNFTVTGQFPFDAPTVEYYDHWGDRQTSARTQGTAVDVVEKVEDSRTLYLPTFSSDDPNYIYIVGGFIALLLVALLARMLHGKKPIEL